MDEPPGKPICSLSPAAPTLKAPLVIFLHFVCHEIRDILTRNCFFTEKQKACVSGVLTVLLLF